MKTFLMTSVLVMIIAGVYGAVDMSKEMNQGTLIDYHEPLKHLPKAKSLAHFELRFDKRHPRIQASENKPVKVKSHRRANPEFSTELFSRGGE
jgi:hypothetical protein